MSIPELLSWFKKDLKSQIAQQTSILYLSFLASIILNFATGILNTRVLGAEGYGVFAFFTTFTTFTLIFFRFGFFNSGSLLLAECRDCEKQKEIIGALTLISFIIGVCYSIFSFIMGFYIDQIFNTVSDLSWIFHFFSFIFTVLPFQLLIPAIGQGTNKIGKMSLFNVLPRIFYLVAAFLLWNIISVEPSHYILLNVASIGLSAVVILKLYEPRFRNLRDNINALIHKNKIYGLQAYIGTIVTQVSYQSSNIIIPMLFNTTDLGYFTLSNTLTNPMVALSRSASTSLFKGFVDMKYIPRRIFYYNLIWLFSISLTLILLGQFIVPFLFGTEFLPVVPFILPMAFASIFQGLYQPLIFFLNSKGLGKELRNAGILAAIIYFAANISLIMIFGVIGAALAALASTSSSFMINLYIYKNYQNKNKKDKN